MILIHIMMSGWNGRNSLANRSTDVSKEPQHSYEALVCIQDHAELATPSTKVKGEASVAPSPSMPCIPSDSVKEHRSKNIGQQFPFPAALSRPVSSKEMLENPEALKKMRDERNGLTETRDIRESLIFEYDSIRNETEINNEEIHSVEFME